MTTATKKIEPGYKQTKVGVIPEDWEVKEIADVSTLKSGLSITSKKIFEMGLYPCYGGNGLRGFANDYTHEGDYALIGRQGALCGNVQFATGQFFASEHAVVVTPSPNTDIKWLSYVLDSMKLNQYSESSAQPGLSVYKIKILDIAYPPTKSEQTAIATALSDMDALIAAQEQLIAKKRAIKHGAMQELLEAKEGWEEKTVGDVGLITTGGTPSTLNNTFWGGEIPWITPTDISILKDISTSERRLTSLGADQIRRLKKNSLLVTCIASIGKNAILRVDGSCNQQINAITPNEDYNIDFLYYLIDYSKEYLKGSAGVTATLILSKKEFSLMKFSFPNLEEQTRIAQILSDMDAEIEQLGVELAKLRGVKKGMMEELLTGAKRLNH